MSIPLSDLSAPALTHAIKANFNAFFRFLRNSSLTEFHEDSTIIRWHTPIPHPWFNGLLCLRDPMMNEANLISDTLAYFQSRRAPFYWWLEPDLPTVGWEKQLVPYGFRRESTPGIAVDLLALNDLGIPSGLRIVPVEDMETLKVWTRTLLISFSLPLAWEPNLFRLFADLGLELPMRNYLGYLFGKPVATSTLFIATGVAGIQFVGTVPEARGQGIGAAMTLAPLLQARDLGYRVGIGQSSEMGYGVYQRLGFQHLCAVENFYWAGEV